MEESTLSAEKLTKAYIRIRDKRASLSASYKEKDSELVNQLEMVRQGLLDYCDKHSVESVKTSEGLFYRTTKTKYWTSDWESMHQFILEHEVPEFLEKRLHQGAVRGFLEENPDLLPKGLNVDSEFAVTVRKA